MGHKHHHHDHPDASEPQANGQPAPAGPAGDITLHARIQQRAYALSQARPGGSDVENWLQAEREINAPAASEDRKKPVAPLEFPQPSAPGGKRKSTGDAPWTAAARDAPAGGR